ncbi:threonine-phosphate decarboxylase CobD [Marinobacter halophilus]|uniref:threonine-phosphate decarboxylase n=1 Tax=Marinobacter halophilus TaxID=1323740 RepID=A0A2T1KJH8_9GAMM|nr:threonine-phosphate decarboxylase CobD [Marinobacter halophilus]PSF10168.1 threonine-phosphate decarboxylase [Marinobacter halophilus]GGC68321.1 threonine-phosphate decarboxylase [Marinobacter halophilus]
MMTFRSLESPEHGGRLQAAVQRWGIPREQWLDLSTGINPVPWPVPEIPPDVWQRLPESDGKLEQTIRAWAGAPDGAGCLPVAGSQAAIMALPMVRARLHGLGRVAVPIPGYREHGHAWARAGFEVLGISPERAAAQEVSWLDGFDVVVWIHPNNPTGQLLPPEHILAWWERLQQRGGWLVVDQAFIEGYSDHALDFRASVPGLIVLRSLGKFFGLAGARAGAVLAESALVKQLDWQLGPWPVNGPARYLMAWALADVYWQAGAVAKLQGDSLRLNTLLQASGFPDPSGTLLFRYVRISNASEIYEGLARRGILVRQFDSPPALRFGLPPDEAGWQKLTTLLEELSYLIDQSGAG